MPHLTRHPALTPAATKRLLWSSNLKSGRAKLFTAQRLRVAVLPAISRVSGRLGAPHTLTPLANCCPHKQPASKLERTWASLQLSHGTLQPRWREVFVVEHGSSLTEPEYLSIWALYLMCVFPFSKLHTRLEDKYVWSWSVSPQPGRRWQCSFLRSGVYVVCVGWEERNVLKAWHFSLHKTLKGVHEG